MRIMIKGGVWKNTEDEILKAAVMKYGLNQWSRIASLLNRKSAKQCKARWYEWLDPNIKKTEWTREEDEKLLHLVKLFPMQWRTIAPIVGRTPTQCLDRYDKLTTMAEKGEHYDARDDPRRLRPGEIDPNPEAKPARPDPVDMDEDEKEMLAEARARLSNTRGKKAKRKAREKQMEEARRLAQLQKKRELKAAGLELSSKFRDKRAVDYSKEVAFERKPTAGFYDTSDEQVLTKKIVQEFRPTNKEEIEGKRRRDVEEALRKDDIKKQKIAERHDAPTEVRRMLAMNEVENVVRRGKMMLPAPQVSDLELAAIAKLQQEGALLGEELAQEGAGGGATRRLLGDYTQTPAAINPASLRTPRTGAGGGAAPEEDFIMAEARRVKAMLVSATPFQAATAAATGAATPSVDVGASDFSGIVPQRKVAATPNPLLAMGGAGGLPGQTPLLLGGPRGGGMTPALHGGAAGALVPPGATPVVRDELGLNDPERLASIGAHGGPIFGRGGLGLGAALPAPKNKYQVVVPEMPEADDVAEEVEEDAAERDARLRAEEEARLQLELRKRSQVLQRGLPRPPAAPPGPSPQEVAAAERAAGGDGAARLKAAETLIAAEMAELIARDNARYPIPGAKSKARDVPPGPDYSLEELEEAAALIRQEAEAVRGALGQEVPDADTFGEAWAEAFRDVIFIPSVEGGRFARASTASAAERVAAIQSEFDGARSYMEGQAKKAAKIEAKYSVLTQGLQNRDASLRAQLDSKLEELDEARTTLRCIGYLRERERLAIPARVEELTALVRAQAEREAGLQETYKQLVQHKADLERAKGLLGAGAS